MTHIFCALVYNINSISPLAAEIAKFKNWQLNFETLTFSSLAKIFWGQKSASYVHNILKELQTNHIESEFGFIFGVEQDVLFFSVIRQRNISWTPGSFGVYCRKPLWNDGMRDTDKKIFWLSRYGMHKFGWPRYLISQKYYLNGNKGFGWDVKGRGPPDQYNEHPPYLVQRFLCKFQFFCKPNWVDLNFWVNSGWVGSRNIHI